MRGLAWYYIGIMLLLKKIFGKAFDVFAVSFAVVIILFIIAVIVRTPFRMHEEKTVEHVAIIHATKLTLDDVMGKNLPPDPGAEADKTVQGIDANANGIRDDVELAIFKEYPDSAKTRAVLLQYALALQMQTTQSIVNKETVTEVVREQSRAYACIGDSVTEKDLQKAYAEMDSLTESVKTRQMNTNVRKKARTNFVEYIGSYSESTNAVCDIDLTILPN